MTTAPEPAPALTAWERRQLRGLAHGLRTPGTRSARGRAVRLGVAAAALAFLAAGIFLALPWLFAACVLANVAVCLHVGTTGSGGEKCRR